MPTIVSLHKPLESLVTIVREHLFILSSALRLRNSGSSGEYCLASGAIVCVMRKWCQNSPIQDTTGRMREVTKKGERLLDSDGSTGQEEQ